MKNKVCIVLTIITVLMLTQLSLFIGNTNAYTVKGGHGDDEYYFDSDSSTLKLTVKGKLNTDYDYISQFAKIVKNIIIEEGLTVIEAETFQGCQNLTNIEIPSSVEKIDVNAFINCNSLENINVSNSNEYYCSVDGVLYNKDKTEIICYPQNRSNTNYKVLEGVIKIGENAFRCAKIENIEIPDSVTRIEYRAFYNCTELQSIELPKNITLITDSTFWNCTGLKDVKIPEGVEGISYTAFRGCTELTNIEIPNSVRWIGHDAFSYCSNLTNLKIPNSVTDMQAGAFAFTNLLSIEIPNSISVLENAVFSGCSNLKIVEIPNNITSIKSSAFNECSSLEKIIIPNSVTLIESDAFRKCSNLIIYCKSNSIAKVYAEENNITYIIDDKVPKIQLKNNDKKIIVTATDEGCGLADKPYSIDNENWQINNNFEIEESGKYTIYVRDKLGNIATKNIDVVMVEKDDSKKADGKNDNSKNVDDKTSTEDDKTKKEDKTPADNSNKNNNSKNANDKTSTETTDVKKAEDKTQAKTVIPQAGATFPIVILIIVSVIGVVGYKKFKKVNY